MHRRITSSRSRFHTYLKDLRQRQQGGNGKPQPETNGKPLHHHRVRSSWELVRQFFALMKPHRGPVLLALATLTVSTILGLVPPAATKFVIDYVLGDKPTPAWLTEWMPVLSDRWNLLLFITFGAFGISVVKTAIHLWGRWYATKATKSMQMGVRRKTFSHAMRLPLHRVYELKSGGVASILREDAGSVGDLIFGMVYNPWGAVIQLIGSVCVLAWVDWRLLLGTLVLVPAVYYSHRTWVKQIRPRYRDIRNRRTDVDGKAAESFGGMRVVRAFSGQRAETGRFMNTNHLMARQELNTWWWTRSMEVVWGLLIPVGALSVLLYGGWQVLEGRLTLGDLMMFLTYLLFLLEPLTVLAQSATQFQNSLSGLDRILDLLAEPREMPPSPDAISLDKSEVSGQIRLENVSFQYAGNNDFALKEVSLTAEPGETVALVGPSGAGKTTLCNLVARFYDPTGGRVLLDGHDLRDIEVENYRSLLGLVEQDVFLFDGTIAENIGYANRHSTLEELYHAARVANALEFIERLPNGFDTIIGERGVKLSGGQRQRIAIARAVLADPRILILDEATSNLDTESERLIQESLEELMRDRTSFVIAHRLSTIAYADKIAVVENGRITEVGNHEELMKANGRYREMVLLQVNMQRNLVTVEKV